MFALEYQPVRILQVTTMVPMMQVTELPGFIILDRYLHATLDVFSSKLDLCEQWDNLVPNL